LPTDPRRDRAHFDRGYVERLIAGDAETERHFVRYFGDLLTAKLRSRLRDPAAAEDAKQETFLRVLVALRKRGGLDTPEALGSFVNSVCNHVLFETYRAQSKVVPLDPEDEREAPEDRPDAESVLLSEESHAGVRRILGELPAKDQELLRWLFVEGRDKDDVCRFLGVDRGYLRVLLHRAKLRFRAAFDPALQ